MEIQEILEPGMATKDTRLGIRGDLGRQDESGSGRVVRLTKAK